MEKRKKQKETENVEKQISEYLTGDETLYQVNFAPDENTYLSEQDEEEQ